MAKKIFLVNLALILLSATVFAQSKNDFLLGEALKDFKPKSLPLSIEARAKEPEFIFRYKNFSLDYNHFDADMHYLKFDVDNEIISLMGTGLDLKYGVTGIDWKTFSPLPTVGFKIYMAIMPKMTIYTQLSGMSFGGRAHVIDTESGVKYSPSKNFSLTAGYRHIAATVRHKDNRGNFKMSEPFIGVRMDF